jgi:hypothetical protein
MVDFIFGVSHTQHWHGLNLAQHPDHYSAMRHLGSGAISWLQDNSGAGVYFNPYVEIDGMVCLLKSTGNCCRLLNMALSIWILCAGIYYSGIHYILREDCTSRYVVSGVDVTVGQNPER